MSTHEDDMLGPGMHHRVELADRTKRAEQELVEQRRRLEMLEAQTRELEELYSKQQEVVSGRKEMSEKLRRSLVMLEREEEAAKREVEQILQSKSVFLQTLDSVERINPEEWNPEDLARELVDSISRIDHARAIFSQHIAKMNVLRSGAGLSEETDLELPMPPNRPVPFKSEFQPQAEGDFWVWLRRGLAFNLFLLILGVVWLVAYLTKP